MSRFFVAVVVVPLVFVACLLAFTLIMKDVPRAAPAIPAALAFAATVVTRGALHSVQRGGLALLGAGIFCVIAALVAPADALLREAALGAGGALAPIGLIAFVVAVRIARSSAGR